MKTLRSEMDMHNNIHFVSNTFEVSLHFQISAQTASPEYLLTVTEYIPRVSTDPLSRFWRFAIRPALRFNTHRSDIGAAV
jgi:hypothetical protein